MNKSVKAELNFSHSINYCASGKPIYDKKGAQTAANKRMEDSHTELRIYPCPDCNGWHLTSSLNKPRRK